MTMAAEGRIDAGIAVLRPYRVEDTEPLQLLADDPEIAVSMRDVFPYPYTHEDAEKWIALATGDLQERTFAIEVAGELAGGAGMEAFKNEARITAEIGYWLGRRFWGRGIATAVVGVLVPWVFDRYPEIVRVQACVYNSNPASASVLEKNDFRHEGTQHRSVTKGGRILDQLVYVRFREDGK